MTNTQKSIRKLILKYSYENSCEHIPSSLSQCDYMFALFSLIDPYQYNFLMGKFYGSQGVYIPLYLNSHIKSLDNLSYFIKKDELSFVVETIDTIGDTLGFVCGLALSGMKNIIVNTSDAVFQSGYMYEALNFINNHDLDILILVDNNNFQVCDKIENINSIEPIKYMIKHMNLKLYEVNGHDIGQCKNIIFQALNENGARIIFFDTIKGYGIKEMENNDKWHYRKLTKNEFEKFMNQLTC